jgi:2-oxo-3-hexenedioate decarboxylase
MSTVTACADALDAARRDRRAIGRLTEVHPELDLRVAYDVQDELVRRALDAGDRVVGAKLGLTARAKQEQMGVREPVYGAVLGSTVRSAHDPVVVAELIHPRVEPEIVLVMGDELRGPGVTAADVLAATRHVCCGMEIIDSRYADFSFTAADVVADNTSAAGVVLGPVFVPPEELDLALVGVLLEADGELVATAAGAATMGHPAEATAALANFLATRGRALEPGWLVFTGGLTAAHPLRPGSHVTATFGHLGSVTVRGA